MQFLKSVYTEDMAILVNNLSYPKYLQGNPHGETFLPCVVFQKL